jgi:hypothetical protein
MLLVWPGGAIWGKWSTRKGRVGSGPWLFQGSKVVALPVSIKDHVVLTLVSKFWFVEPHVPASRWFLEVEWGSLGWRLGRMIAGNQDFIPRARTQFWSSRGFAEGCRTWHLRGHAYDVLLGFSPAGCIPIWITATPSDMSDRLLVVCFDGWFSGLWLWLS